MSVKISGQVWELELDPMDKFFLLCVADHADHDGKNIKPGNDLICAKTGLSHQTVSAKIAKFTEAGVLIPATESYGRGKPREFEMELVGIERRDYFIQKDHRKMQARRSFETAERCKLTERKVQADSEKVQVDKFLHDKERARVEPSEPSIEPSEREQETARVSFVEAENTNQPFAPNDDFVPAPLPQWSVAERFILKACELWDELANQEKPVVETNWKTKQSVKVAGKFVAPRLDVEKKIGGTPKLFREFWHDKLKRDVSPRPDYVVEQWDAYDRWLIENHETHRRAA